MPRLKNSQTELEKLKKLLLADELDQLKKLESKVETLDFEAKDDATIMKRVTPAISKGIADNKETMIDALYPIMGGMISKYVTQAIKELMETINKKIENGLSFERYKRKAKAKLTGVSETELLLEESSNATISSLFVIQKESSLLIAEAHLEDKEIDDAHMVASMASAIKDFINDWAQNNEMGSEVQILSYGNATLYIESAGSVFLVAFLDAEPDYEQRAEINAFFASVLKEYSDFFQNFDGDDSAQEVVSLSMKMEDYLYAQIPVQTAKSKKNPAKYIFIFLGILLFAYVLYRFQAWYITESLERKIYTQTAEHISVEKKSNMFILNGQITSLEKLDTMHKILRDYKKNTKIQDNLTLALSSMDQRFKTLGNMGAGAYKRVDEKLKLLERSFATSIDALNAKVLQLNQTLEKRSTELSNLIKHKDGEIAILKQNKEKMTKIIAVKNEMQRRLDQIFNGNVFYLPEEHALDFRRLNLFEENKAVYEKNAIIALGKTFEKYMRVLVDYKAYIERIEIEGHSDSTGQEIDNIHLSKKRALSVLYYLNRLQIVKQYHMSHLMHARGLGSAERIIRNGVEDKNASRRIKVKCILSDSKIVQKLGEIIDD